MAHSYFLWATFYSFGIANVNTYSLIRWPVFIVEMVRVFLLVYKGRNSWLLDGVACCTYGSNCICLLHICLCLTIDVRFICDMRLSSVCVVDFRRKLCVLMFISVTRLVISVLVDRCQYFFALFAIRTSCQYTNTRVRFLVQSEMLKWKHTHIWWLLHHASTRTYGTLLFIKQINSITTNYRVSLSLRMKPRLQTNLMT